MSLTGVMIGGAVLAIVATGTAEMFSHQTKALQGLRAASNRDQLAARVARLAGNGAALRASADADSSTLFAKCTKGLVPDGCASTATSEFASFTLRDPLGSSVTGFYDANGARCGSASDATEQCPIEVETKFKATCPNGGATCQMAKTITVQYRIWQKMRQGSGIVTPLKDISGTILSSIPLDSTASAALGYLPRWNSGSELSASTVFQDADTNRVGIGTTSPQTALEVNGPITVGPGAAAGGAPCSTPGAIARDSAGDLYLCK